jgi:hypothetical protein
MRRLTGCLAIVLGALLTGRGAPEPDAAAKELHGLWSRYESRAEGDLVRFYYFHHQGGIGLYRYGRVGHNKTNSYDWSVEGGRLALLFRKTGERRRAAFRIERDPKDKHRDWLVLQEDPRDEAGTRYFRDRPAGAGPQAEWGRMWTEEQRFAAGGMGFRIYQLKDAAIDGRGIGWYHEGDYDDWSTESLSYRVQGRDLELQFPLRAQRLRTPFTLQQEGKERVLRLQADPRNFWHRSRFVDRGKSFGMLGPGSFEPWLR